MLSHRVMLSGRVVVFSLAAVLALSATLRAQIVIPEETLNRHGLTRGWRVQVELNRAMDRIGYITQQGGVLYVQTAHAFVHALDAETGKKIWSSQIGQPSQISLAPGVNHKYLAIINGSTLYVLDRTTGREKYRKVLGGSPGTGPALTDKMVFVSMVSGMIEGYDLENQRALPWHHRAAGRILTQPIVSEGNLAWTTDKGFFYVAQADPPMVRFRVEAHAEISARPAHWTPFLYACSQNGFLYAVNEATGETEWKFPGGASFTSQPAAVNGRVYVVSDIGQLFCVEGRSGEQLWSARNMQQFCCLSAAHVYAIDQFDRLAILDAQHGNRLSTLPLGDVQMKLINQQTDRIYLASATGVIQCIHEIGQRKPLVYAPPPLKKKHKDEEHGGAAAGESEEGAAKAGDDAPEGEMKDAAEGDAMPEEEGKEGEDADNPFNN
jgi:PQQ-like domain